MWDWGVQRESGVGAQGGSWRRMMVGWTGLIVGVGAIAPYMAVCELMAEGGDG